LLGVPNFSEGSSERIVRALEATVGAYGDVLDVHFDHEHNRSVITAAFDPERIAAGLFEVAAQAIELIDMTRQEGLHPRIGAMDVCPVVYPDPSLREDAKEKALTLAERLGGELELPVFLYGELAMSDERRERAYFRRGGPAELAQRMASGDLVPDFGPIKAHPRGGATMVTARPPLVAFNLELDTTDPTVARKIAEQLREAGGGLPGVRALGLPRERGGAQVSINVHNAEAVPLADVVKRVEELASEHDACPIEAELVGLVPKAALAGYPEHVPIAGFDPAKHVIERRLGKRAR
jgi:glutamate formiminotransferase